MREQTPRTLACQTSSRRAGFVARQNASQTGRPVRQIQQRRTRRPPPGKARRRAGSTHNDIRYRAPTSTEGSYELGSRAWSPRKVPRVPYASSAVGALPGDLPCARRIWLAVPAAAIRKARNQNHRTPAKSIRPCPQERRKNKLHRGPCESEIAGDARGTRKVSTLELPDQIRKHRRDNPKRQKIKRHHNQNEDKSCSSNARGGSNGRLLHLQQPVRLRVAQG